MQMLVSIIVPIYNAQDYLKECLKSITEQTYADLEIILIDDGSTDESLKICKEMKRDDSRIIVIHQENKGVVAARKAGVNFSNGEYIMFVDADDFLDDRMVDSLMQENKGYDLITSGFWQEYKTPIKRYDAIEAGEYATETQIEYVVENMIMFENTYEMGIIRSFCAKLWKATLVKKVFEELNEKIFCGEDGEFLYRYILQCQSIKVTDICGYHYRVREDSVMHSTNKRYLENIDQLYRSLEPVFCEHSCRKGLLIKLEKWIKQMLSDVPFYLGFVEESVNYSYIYPLTEETVSKRIILYGAGKVGQSYKALIEKMRICEIALWVDSNHSAYKEAGKRVSSIEEINDIEFDYVVIAVNSEEVSESIRNNLENLKIPGDKILWKKPFRG